MPKPSPVRGSRSEHLARRASERLPSRIGSRDQFSGCIASGGGDSRYPAFITSAGSGWLADRVAGLWTTQIHRSFGQTYATTSSSFVSKAVRTGFNRCASGQVAHSLAAIGLGIAGAVLGRLAADHKGPVSS